MDDKLKGIIQKGIRATALWLFSYVLGFLRNFGIGRGGRTDIAVFIVLIRFSALLLFAVCIYELLVYKNIIK